MRCQAKKFDRIFLCPEDLTHFIAISKREIKGDKPGVGTGRTEIVPVKELYAAVETTTGYVQTQNEGVTADDIITHVWYYRYDDYDINSIDVRSNVLTEGDRVFRIVKMQDLNEMKTTVALYCNDRGFGGKSGT